MHVRRAQLEDVSDIGTVAGRAIWDDPLTDFIYINRNKHPSATRYQILQLAKKRFYNGAIMLVMVTDHADSDWDGHEKVVACLSLVRNVQDDKAQGLSWTSWLNLRLHWLEDQLTWYLHLDPSSSRQNTVEFLNRAQERDSRQPFKDNPQHYEIGGLNVDPDYQRKGIGGRLLKEAQSIVASDESSVPLVVIASSKGEGLYRKYGFSDVERWNFNESEANLTMIWEPPSNESIDTVP